MSWLGAWTRAVIVPAAHRALPIWLGAGILGAVIFGGTGMHPADLTGLAVRVPPVGVVLAATWLLVFLPTARLIVRADAARYLRSLPAPRWRTRVIGTAALVGLQLPWLALWLLGARAPGVAMIAASTLAVAVLARWRARPPRVGSPRWRGDGPALRGIYVRGLRRRAIDALVRAAGLAVLAGLAAALFVRNNDVEGRAAGILATTVIVIVLVPGWASALLAIIETHRAAAWLAHSLGISETRRLTALAVTVGGLYALTTAIAVAAALVIVPGSGAWIAAIALGASIALALLVTRILIWADRGGVATGARIIIGVIVASALAVLALGLA